MSAPHFGRRITDKLDLFSLCLLGFIGFGSWLAPLTIDQRMLAGNAFLAVLAYIMRRWTASLRDHNEKRNGDE